LVVSFGRYVIIAELWRLEVLASSHGYGTIKRYLLKSAFSDGGGSLWHKKTRVSRLSRGVVCVILRLAVFSERDTYVHVRYMLSAVRLSSVTLVHPTQPVEIFGNFFHHMIAQGL